jgi:preprotein translocase subunit SecY
VAAHNAFMLGMMSLCDFCFLFLGAFFFFGVARYLVIYVLLLAIPVSGRQGNKLKKKLYHFKLLNGLFGSDLF